jgi:two-component system response regulator YesN
MKANTLEYLEEERDILLAQIKQEIEKTRYQLTIASGAPKERLSDIYQSFIEALASIQNQADRNRNDPNQAFYSAELLKVDSAVIDNYLRCGAKDGFDEFFDGFIRPVAEMALKSHLIKDYIFMDVFLAAAKLVNELGGDIEQELPAFASIETILENTQDIATLREEAQKILFSALEYRDGKSGSQHTAMIHQAKAFIERHYADPELSLNQVAGSVNLSASYFSVVFSQETCQTFKEYLTALRISKAKALLRSTALRTAEIAYQVGYNDPHYFSAAFKKETGLSPTEFRQQSAPG